MKDPVTGECNGISAAYDIEGVPAFIVPVQSQRSPAGAPKTTARAQSICGELQADTSFAVLTPSHDPPKIAASLDEIGSQCQCAAASFGGFRDPTICTASVRLSPH